MFREGGIMGFEDYLYIGAIIVGIIALIIVKELWIKYVIAISLGLMAVLKVIFGRERKRENIWYKEELKENKKENEKKIINLDKQIKELEADIKKDKKESSNLDEQIKDLEEELK